MAFQSMGCRGLRSFASTRVFFFFFAFVLLFGDGFLAGAFGQESSWKTNSGSLEKRSDGRNSSYPSSQRDKLKWNRRGRTVPPGESAAGLRFRAYRQKLAMRARRAGVLPVGSSRPPKRSLDGAPSSSSSSSSTPSASSVVWSPVGPSPLASDATGDGEQDYNWVSGRATSVLIDPADITGNTVLLGGAYGGLWKSTNAGSLSSSPSSVTWQALIDDQPTLAVGAIALATG